jgi:hypothetical protein
MQLMKEEHTETHWTAQLSSSSASADTVLPYFIIIFFLLFIVQYQMKL